MTRRGRPPKGAGLVEQLEGSEAAKERLKQILKTFTGELTVAEASRMLGIGEARFHALRCEMLEAATQALEPKAKGRPAAPEPTQEKRELTELKEQVDDLTVELKAAHIRTKIALVMPHLLVSEEELEAEDSKKKSPRKPAPSTPSTSSSGGTSLSPRNSTPSSGTST